MILIETVSYIDNFLFISDETPTQCGSNLKDQDEIQQQSDQDAGMDHPEKPPDMPDKADVISTPVLPKPSTSGNEICDTTSSKGIHLSILNNIQIYKRSMKRILEKRR